MLYLVHVTFLENGSLCPEEFFQRIDAVWSMMEPSADSEGLPGASARERAGCCIADYQSIEQLAQDLSIMPGAGIGTLTIEALPVQSVQPSLNN